MRMRASQAVLIGRKEVIEVFPQRPLVHFTEI
jgi:hypothetical protein